MVMYTNLVSAVPSVLSSFSRNPGVTEFECLVQAAKHFLSIAGVPTVFYVDQATVQRGVGEAFIFHGYADAGETGETDGGGRRASVIKPGAPGTISGAMQCTSKKVNISTSTPADETDALYHTLILVDVFRTMVEEFAGLRRDVYNAAQLVPGSPPPTSISSNAEAVRAINSTDTGDTRCVVRTETIRRVQLARAVSPTTVIGDNKLVMSILDGDGVSKLKNLRPSLREFRALYQARLDGVIEAVLVASLDNISNPISKLPHGPLDHILGLEGLLGKSPQMDELKARAQAAFGKAPRGEGSGSSRASVDTGTLALAAQPAWATHATQGVNNLFEHMGFVRAQDQQPESEAREGRKARNKKGIGYGRSISAFVAALQDMGDYSASYRALALPTPPSRQWDELVSANHDANAGSSKTALYDIRVWDCGGAGQAVPGRGDQDQGGAQGIQAVPGRLDDGDRAPAGFELSHRPDWGP
jgi:hypothetical protein